MQEAIRWCYAAPGPDYAGQHTQSLGPRDNMSGDPIEQINEHLDKTDDPILVILRAHLLVEERLRDILAQISRAPEELRAARLSFHPAFCLCRAVIGRQDEPAWSSGG